MAGQTKTKAKAESWPREKTKDIDLACVCWTVPRRSST